MYRKLNLVVLTTLVLLAPALLAACASEDAAPAGLTRAEVVEIVRAEAPAAPVATPAAPAPSQPGLSRAEVEEIAWAAVAAMPRPEAEPGLTRSDVEEIVRGVVQAAMAEAAAGQSQLTEADVQRIARSQVAYIPLKSAPADYTRFFVQNAISRYDADGLDATLAYYNRQDGIDDQWYVFIIDAAGEVIGHYDSHLIGENLNGPVGTDANGYNFGPEMLSATDAGKWVSYVYHNPERGIDSRDFDELELKNVWVQRHDGLLFASGWYINADEFTQNLVAVAIERFRDEGLEGTIAYFASPGNALAGLESTVDYYNSTETTEGRWSALFVAHSNPAMIGRDVQDLFGPEPLEVSEEGQWVSNDSMHIWVRSHAGYLFGSGWHRDVPAAAAPAEIPTASATCQLVLDQDPPGQPGGTPLRVDVIAENLEVPWGLAILPNGDLLVTERPGRVRLIQAGEIVPEPVLEFGVSILPPLGGHPIAGSEGGLLGVTLHPEFAANRLFYIFYNIDNADGVSVGRIERYALSADGRSATLDRLIMDGLPAGLHHQGGRMRIGPDGMLYVGVGAYNPPEAQNPDTPAGKLLRMDLDGGIPADNPDPNSYVFASGIRNTQGYDWFDDRHIVMVDHGPSGFELDMPDLAGYDELNVVTAGDNLGWPVVWGCAAQEGLVSPVLMWEGSVPPTGATFYRGDRIPEWTGSFLFTTVGLNERFTGRTMHGRHLHRVELDPDNPYTVVSHEMYLQNAYGRLRTIVEDADGYLYVMTSNCDNRGECPPEGDKILRIGPDQ